AWAERWPHCRGRRRRLQTESAPHVAPPRVHRAAGPEYSTRRCRAPGPWRRVPSGDAWARAWRTPRAVSRGVEPGRDGDGLAASTWLRPPAVREAGERLALGRQSWLISPPRSGSQATTPRSSIGGWPCHSTQV